MDSGFTNAADDMAMERDNNFYRDRVKDAKKSHPKLQRGKVWCRTCGRSIMVDSSECLKSGWPKCCGYTMTIDAPRRVITA